jgi:hypothetical protein
MSQHYEKHAEQVSNAFIGMLDDGVQADISDEQGAKLTMMVEAAISTAVLEELEHAAGEVAALSQRLRNRAERYEKS